MKNHDFAKIFIFILLNSSVYTQEIKQIVNNPMPNHQFPEIQSTFPEIQSIDSPSIQVQNSDTNIRLSKANKVTEVRSDTVSNKETGYSNLRAAIDLSAYICFEILSLILQIL